ncbi:hypothetical protein MIR68_005847 [Amoeboaphelidium protococcarum]|nr:hypothetical protein MIR68_005847 [Amoeboaphelidium protococcarum]
MKVRFCVIASALLLVNLYARPQFGDDFDDQYMQSGDESDLTAQFLDSDSYGSDEPSLFSSESQQDSYGAGSGFGGGESLFDDDQLSAQGNSGRQSRQSHDMSKAALRNSRFNQEQDPFYGFVPLAETGERHTKPHYPDQPALQPQKVMSPQDRKRFEAYQKQHKKSRSGQRSGGQSSARPLNRPHSDMKGPSQQSLQEQFQSRRRSYRQRKNVDYKSLNGGQSDAEQQ